MWKLKHTTNTWHTLFMALIIFQHRLEVVICSFWVYTVCVCVCVRVCVCVCVCARACAQSLSSVWLLVTPWTVTHQAPLSMEFSREEYWSRLPFLPPGGLPNPRIKLGLGSLNLMCVLHRQADSLPQRHWETLISLIFKLYIWLARWVSSAFIK